MNSPGPAQVPLGAAFSLRFGTVSIPLFPGAQIDATALPGQHTLQGPMGRVGTHAQDPSDLVLLNQSKLSWSVQLADKSLRVVEPKKALKLSAGVFILFGSVTGEVVASELTQAQRSRLRAPPPVELRPAPRDELEALARALTSAAKKGLLSREEFDKLHRAFLARDDYGGIWTLGLKTIQWHCSDGSQWLPATPPPTLSMTTRMFETLTGLKSRVAKSAS